MGKVVLLDGVDFSQNSVGTIMFGDFILKASGYGAFYLSYQGRDAITISKSSQEILNQKLFAYKINPDLIGKEVNITSANYVIDGAYYCAFVSDLGYLTFSEIPNLSGSSLPSGQPVYHELNSIENFNVSSVEHTKKTITKTIPAGAKYLLVTADFNGNLSENDVKVEVVVSD